MNTKLATAQIRVKNWTAIEYSCAMGSSAIIRFATFRISQFCL